MTFLIILFAIFMFGFLIATHEFGHYLFARLFHVSIEEYSIGMGPKLFSHVSKKSGIRYSLRLLPFGGYVSMVGEDTDSPDPNALCHKAPWKRLIIMAAGGITNLITGVLLCLVFVILSRNALLSVRVGGFIESQTPIESSVSEREEESPAVPEETPGEETPARYATSSYVLRPGDEILSVNGKRVRIYSEFSFRVMWEAKEGRDVLLTDENGDPVLLHNVAMMDVRVLRDGAEVDLVVPFRVTVSEGLTVGVPDVRVYADEPTFGNIMKHTFCESRGFVMQVWASLGGLFTGRVGLSDMSGPVGITQEMTEVAGFGFEYLIYLAALIAINLGVVNLLPIPALDGGRIVFLLIEWIRGKPVKREIENRIHTVMLLLLFLLMIFILIKDVFGLFF